MRQITDLRDIRGSFPVQEFRADGESEPVMAGHFSVFNRWTEIDSWEGRFKERFAPGAFKKTIREGRDRMQVLFQHGYDSELGEKALGKIQELREDEKGVYYEVGLLDGIPDLLLNGLRAGLYGASFRFEAIRETVVDRPKRSDDNPEGLPERTVTEARVPEFGPVTFPAYEDASAGIRSSVRSIHPNELALAAAFERASARDAEQAHELAVRFAALTPEHLDDQTASRGDSESVTDEEPAEPEGTEAEATAEAEDNVGNTQDAPPSDSAEPAEAHPGRGRRAGRYGLPPKKPAWQLPSGDSDESPAWRLSKEK